MDVALAMELLSKYLPFDILCIIEDYVLDCVILPSNQTKVYYYIHNKDVIIHRGPTKYARPAVILKKQPPRYYHNGHAKCEKHESPLGQRDVNRILMKHEIWSPYKSVRRRRDSDDYSMTGMEFLMRYGPRTYTLSSDGHWHNLSILPFVN